MKHGLRGLLMIWDLRGALWESIGGCLIAGNEEHDSGPKKKAAFLGN